jgi:shikimate kinase
MGRMTRVGLMLDRSIVLVGLMGAGKSSIGKRLAETLGLEFIDADAEIEAAAGLTISEIFDRYGEDEFRAGERRVMNRLLDGPVRVIATGGGAFMDPQTRALVKSRSISLWLRASLDVLLDRTSRSRKRPLLEQGDRKQVLEDLIAKRYPVYAEADLVIDSDNRPQSETVQKVIGALRAFVAGERAEQQAQSAD